MGILQQLIQPDRTMGMGKENEAKTYDDIVTPEEVRVFALRMEELSSLAKNAGEMVLYKSSALVMSAMVALLVVCTESGAKAAAEVEAESLNESAPKRGWVQ
jgi:hypothetical protein